VALSRHGLDLLIRQQWAPSELRFGVDFLLACTAAAHSWTAVPLAVRRRNKLRSFSAIRPGEYRMGAKFAEVATTIQHRAANRLRRSAPQHLVVQPAAAPAENRRAVPNHDPDIAELAESTTRRLRADAAAGAFAVFPKPLAARLCRHAASAALSRGLSWPDWRECLFAWIGNHDAAPGHTIPVELLETLFLSRVVGHHSEIAGTLDWYRTVREQARDAFAHRHALWRRP
jgi:hypothetical protein